MSMRRPLLLLTILMLLAQPVAAQTLRGIRKEFAAVGDRVIPATVIVRALERKDKRIQGSSGVIIHEKGYVLSDADATLTHFTQEEKDGVKTSVKHHGVDAVVKLPAPDHREFRAIVIKRDAESDTTLLKLKEPPKDLPFVSVGTSDDLDVGAFNIVVGNTFGSGMEGEPSLSMGVVSALVKRDALGAGKYETIVTSAAVNPGSNGGPCVDAEGRIVGIISTYDAKTDSPFRALGLVTPIDRIRARYSGVENFDEIFPDPRMIKPRSDEAAVIEEAFAIIARRTYPSLVSIEVTREGAKGSFTAPNPIIMQLRRMGRKPPPGLPTTVQIPIYPGPYSGVVLREDGYLLTCTANLWEFKTIKSIKVHLTDGRSLPGEIVARDRYRGVALLKVEAEGLAPLPLATKGDLKVGRFALAVGNPFGEKRQGAPLFTFGVVSGVNRLANINPDLNAIQTDAGMTDGMVGGALVTLTGKFLGLNLLHQPDRYGRNSGIGFAIPMTAMEKSLPRLMRGDNVEPGKMGVGLDTNVDGDIVFRQVNPKGPSGTAGVKNGDILLEVDGRSASRFADQADFVEYVRGKGPGYEMQVKVQRGGDTAELTIKLGAPSD